MKELWKTKKSKIIGFVITLLLVSYVAIGLYTGLRVTRIDYYNIKIPKEFDGYKIVQISDLHCEMFGKEQEKLIQMIEEENPDLLVITGDMIDKDRWNEESITTLLDGISGLAPIYAVTGNNEYDAQDLYDRLKKIYEEYGVELLRDEKVQIQREGASIYIYGMYYRYYVSQQNFNLRGEKNQFNLLLYHDPSQFDRLDNNGFDLILAGHTHGGIVRLPLVGGIIVNSGTSSLNYDYGFYETEDCDMFVSTGLGDLQIPRFYNRPEIVSITLRAE